MIISNLEKNMGGFKLHIEDMVIPQGHIYGLLGPNGSGKSTLSKVLAGLIKPDAGHIDYLGVTQGEITLIPQKPYLMRDTVEKNLLYPLKLRGIAGDRGKVAGLLELAGLTGLKDAYAPGLSSGEGQKLALIRALIFEPKIIFVDETFSNMDMESQMDFEGFILQMQKETKATWVIISHQLGTIKNMCDYVFYLEKGGLVEEGAVPGVLQNPQTVNFAHFLSRQ